MKKDTTKFCNSFDCWHNDKAKCTAQKLVGKRSQCLFYEKKPQEKQEDQNGKYENS